MQNAGTRQEERDEDHRHRHQPERPHFHDLSTIRVRSATAHDRHGGALNVDAVAEKLPAIRERTGLPVGVGFGIRDAATAKRIAAFADAVVVGSRIIEEIEKSSAETACANVKALVADIRRGVDEVKK